MSSVGTPGIEEANGSGPDWSHVAELLGSALKLSEPPIAISFHTSASDVSSVSPHGAPFAKPTAGGRTGRVAAGCVFWTQAQSAEFKTQAQDHANCSVGSVTHGFKSVSDVAESDDVGVLLESGWVGESDLSSLPAVREYPEAVVYGPLGQSTVEPDVVLVRVDARGLMTIKDAVGDLAIEGKPQCHIIAIAKEQGQVAASVGCALSRARTGMRADELTCAFPARSLPQLAHDIAGSDKLNSKVASYAGSDAHRFRDDSIGEG